jgi:flagellar biosynthesis/type III secretory pathway protein FliH
LPFFTRNEWLERRVEDLSKEKADAERKHIAAEKKLEKKLEETALEIKKEREQFQEVQDRHAIQLRVKEDAIAERDAILARHEEDKDSGERPKWIPNSKGPNADLYDAVWNLGDKTTKAIREMRNLVSGKNRPEQAFARWEKSFCKQSIKLVQLEELMRSKHDKLKLEFKEKEAVLEARESIVRDKESELSNAAEALHKDRQAFSVEQKQWRVDRAKNLHGTDLEAVQKLWLTAQEERVKPALRAEAKRQSNIEVKNQLELAHRAACTKARSEGHTQGLAEGLKTLEEQEHAAREAGDASGYQRGFEAGEEAGLRNGFATGWDEGHDADHVKGYNEDQDEGYNEGYQKGHDEGWDKGWNSGRESGKEEGVKEGKAAGIRQGRLEGHAEGEKLAQTVKDEIFYRGLHTGVLQPLWRTPSIYRTDQQPNEIHPYWQGRAVVQLIRSQNK